MSGTMTMDSGRRTRTLELANHLVELSDSLMELSMTMAGCGLPVDLILDTVHESYEARLDAAMAMAVANHPDGEVDPTDLRIDLTCALFLLGLPDQFKPEGYDERVKAFAGI